MDSHVEMNIGLTVAGGPNSDSDILARGCLAVRLLAQSLMLARVNTRIERVSYSDPGGATVSESTLVVRAAMRASRPMIRDIIHEVARRLAQDCIAVLFVADDGDTSGEMIGPQADKWPAFNPEFFVRFDAVADATERRAA